MKQKIVSTVVAVFLLSLLVLAWPGSSPHVFAATSTTTAECAGNPLTVSLTGPSSVVTGSVITATNVSSTSTAPNGITVNKIVSTSNVTNGSPAQVIGTWTGNGVNTFTAQFPDFSLTATGAAGSQLKATLTSIDLYVNGGATPITCSVGNGELTASAPGESLTIATVNITAPLAAPSGGTGAAGSTKKAAPAAPAAVPVTPTVAPVTSPIATAAQTHSVVSSSSRVTIIVKDDHAKPIKNAKVVIDSLSTGFTDNKGAITFASIPYGSHKLAVLANNKTISRDFVLGAKNVSSTTLTVALPKQTLPAAYKAGAAGILLLVIAVVVIGLRLHKRASNPLAALATLNAQQSPVLISPQIELNPNASTPVTGQQTAKFY